MYVYYLYQLVYSWTLHVVPPWKPIDLFLFVLLDWSYKVIQRGHDTNHDPLHLTIPGREMRI